MIFIITDEEKKMFIKFIEKYKHINFDKFYHSKLYSNDCPFRNIDSQECVSYIIRKHKSVCLTVCNYCEIYIYLMKKYNNNFKGHEKEIEEELELEANL